MVAFCRVASARWLRLFAHNAYSGHVALGPKNGVPRVAKVAM